MLREMLLLQEIYISEELLQPTHSTFLTMELLISKDIRQETEETILQ